MNATNDNRPKQPFKGALVGIGGKAGAGKSTAADLLIKHYGFRRVPFSDPIKLILGYCFGLTDAELNGAAKTVPTTKLMGRTPRYAMQTLGTGWGRELMHPDIWTHMWRQLVEVMLVSGINVVEDGTRFPNEVEAIKDLGGAFWWLDRDNAQLQNASDAHASETGIIKASADFVFDNSGTEATLRAVIENEIEDYMFHRLGDA